MILLPCLKKQKEIDVLIFIINATSGLTESSKNIVSSYCGERVRMFVIITHLDLVCRCKGPCHRSCEEVCKQRIIDAIEEISPETLESDNELIHCVNPKEVPLRNDNTGCAARQIPPEWVRMEKCLKTFIYDQFYFHKLSPIKNYLQKLMYDVTLLTQLNIAMVAPKINETTGKIRKLQDSIGQLEDEHYEAYIKAKKKIDETISDTRDYILTTMNDLKEHPEKLISEEAISSIDLKNVEAELHRIIRKRWKEFEEECNQKVEEYIRNCTNYIDQLVKGFPKSSTHDSFIPIKMMLQDLDFDASGIGKPKTSLKSKIQEIVRQVLSDLEEASMHSWTRIMYRTVIDKLSAYSKKGLKLIMGIDGGVNMPSNERQESR
jgi:mitofusin